MALGLLFPIIEGMALFTEFDVIPHREGEVYSLPLQLTALLYIDHTRVDDDLDPAISGFLLQERSSEDLVRRKAAVLAQPLRRPGEGYLPGYLMIKQLRLKLAVRDERLWHADVFLRFMYLYIFCDLALVARLLEPDDGVHDRYARVADAINDRLDRLYSMDGPILKDMVDQVINLDSGSGDSRYVAWDDYSAQRSRLENGPLLGADPELKRVGIDLLVSELEQLRLLASADQQLQSAVGHALQLMFLQRDTFRVVHEPARFRIVTAGTPTLLLQYGGLSMAAQLAAGIPMAEGEYDGTISGYIVPSVNTSFIAVAMNGQVLALSVIGDLPNLLKDQLAHYRMDGSEVLEALQQLHELAERNVRLDKRIAIISDGIQSQIASWHAHLAVAYGAPYVEIAQRDTVLEGLDRSSFAYVVGSAENLRALAAISLLASFQVPEDFVAEYYEVDREAYGCENSYADVAASIRERGSHVLNDPLLLDGGRFLVSMV